MIADSENIARAIFSPRMVVEGKLIPAAFELRESIKETYLSVMRTNIPSWEDEILLIPQRKNRLLYGYAIMNVGDVRTLKLNDVEYDVLPFPTEVMKSHAGITISHKGKQLQGGTRLESLAPGVTEDFLLLAIRSQLITLAQKNLVKMQEQHIFNNSKS